MSRKDCVRSRGSAFGVPERVCVCFDEQEGWEGEGCRSDDQMSCSRGGVPSA